MTNVQWRNISCKAFFYAKNLNERIEILKTKDYGVPICRILNMWQIILYKTNGLNELETYVSKNKDGEYKIVYVFDRDKSQELFTKFRNHELEVGANLFDLEKI